VYTTAQYAISRLEIANGRAFFDPDNGVVSADLRTGKDIRIHTWDYTDDSGGVVWELDAGGDRVAVELGQGPNGYSEVVAFPATGGPGESIARTSRDGAPCWSTPYLADVTEAGEVVTDETNCHTAHRDYPGTLYAYGPSGRSVFADRYVPHAAALELDDYVEIAGDWYLVMKDDGDPPVGVYVVNRVTGARRVLMNRVPGVASPQMDVNAAGDVTVRDEFYEDDDTFHEVTRVFPHDGAEEEIVAPTGTAVWTELCGRRLWIMHVRRVKDERDLVKLTVRDTPTAPERTVFLRHPERARTLWGTACDGDDFAFALRTRKREWQIRERSP
jgi:hypothetical protein